MPSLIEPGMRVRHPDRPDWGEGQVQSVIGDRITVNFRERRQAADQCRAGRPGDRRHPQPEPRDLTLGQVSPAPAAAPGGLAAAGGRGPNAVNASTSVSGNVVHDRSVRPTDLLSPRLGHRPLRPALRLLHGGGHDLPAEAGGADARGAGPALRRLHRPWRREDPPDRRRAAGAEERHLAVPQPRRPARWRRAAGADGHHQRHPAGAYGRGPLRRRRPADQCLARYAGPRRLQGGDPLGRDREGAGRHLRRQGGRPRGQDQRRRTEGRERGRDTTACWPGAASTASTSA